MNNKEAELVQLSNCFPYDKMSYNLTPGGHSPIMFGESNPAYGKNPFRNKSKEWYEDYLAKMYDINVGKNNPMYGKNPLENMELSAYEARNTKISIAQSGNRNSQAGISPKDRMDEKTYSIWKLKLSVTKKGKNNPVFGRKWMYNPVTKEKVYSKKEDVQKYLSLGFVFGTGKKKS